MEAIRKGKQDPVVVSYTRGSAVTVRVKIARCHQLYRALASREVEHKTPDHVNPVEAMALTRRKVKMAGSV